MNLRAHLIYGISSMPRATTERIGISLGGGIGPGSTVSLNMTRAMLIEVDGGFFLNEGRPTGMIPIDLSEKAIRDLQQALDDEAILLGSIPRYPDKPRDLLADFCDKLLAADRVEDAKKAVSGFFRAMKKENTDRMEIRGMMEKMLAFELQNTKRPDIIAYIQAGLDKMEGPTRITESVIGDTLLHIPAKEEHVETPIAENPDI